MESDSCDVTGQSRRRPIASGFGLSRVTTIRLAYISLALGLATALLLSLWFTPDPRGLGTHEQLFLPPCNFYAMTGLPCPFCGMTTAFSHMTHGHVREAFMTQPMGAIGCILCVILLPVALSGAISGKNVLQPIIKLPWEKVGWAVGFFILLSWLFKIATPLAALLKI
ncbi:MAG: DUF2752 domain-containing protein [Candidatus Abyssobacteria bacterium SURF_17]|uniref:DUF2752 domain-containing protein n=1 Tax=Candidatus Abyssobacteria bacterium SURF_17 TaxID=2093361 RepID=A0A419F195_9BACT|nr:MAG: DUF2752 domain-containing protein [Candidatus Abyssubacteria bacterium SURF_17]